ncbi:MAG: TonB-dependent receptor [Alphaproteobacteria bacterium]|nr:TonB-dependent receptor [Alphaproteobacteria bacterium]
MPQPGHAIHVRHARLLLGATFLLATTNPVRAADDEIVVFARERSLIGKAESASQGVVGHGDFTTRPLSRVGELVEVIPGMIATQHSGTGKANQYFLRGFNLDHGTDFAAFADGVPVNMRTHGHGQGYLDLNFLIPEIVETVAYRKGPYYADLGDFSSAGAAMFKTYDTLERNFVTTEIGEYGYYRAVAGVSDDLLGGSLLLAGEAASYDGPWELDEELEKFNGLVKFSAGPQDAQTTLILTGYGAQWNATDQIPQRAVESGAVGRFGHVDGDLAGETLRASASLAVDLGPTQLSAYGIYYDFNLFSDFTYFAADPASGDEFEQADRRWVYGGAVRHEMPLDGLGLRMALKAGGDIRFDDILEVGLFQTAGRGRLATLRRDSVEELSLDAFVEAKIALAATLDVTLGLRADYYEFDVESHIPANSGRADDAILSPKFGLAWRALPSLELYANYGQGFHSNDGRGSTIAVDPATLGPAEPVEPLVKSEGAEIGLRAEPLAGLNLTLAAFWLDLDSELVFVGDAGTTEASEGTRRFGIELGAFWRPEPWLVLDLTAAATQARFEGDPPGGDRVVNAVESVVGGGATLLLSEGITASLRVRHFGEAALIEDNSVRSEPTTLVNLGLSYERGPFKVGLEALNLLDAQDNDIAYFYESRLAGEASPVEDIHFHPVEPRAVRAALTLRF